MEFVFDVDLNSFLVDVEIDVLQILILISFERFIDKVQLALISPLCVCPGMKNLANLP